MVETAAVGYAHGAQQYWDAGWRSVLPLPTARKKFPPSGYTGYAAIEPSYPDILQWVEHKPHANICLRLPDGVIGIDVDAYGERTGADTVVEAEKRWGALPAAPRSSSRPDDPISGISLYTVPLGTRLRTTITFPDENIGNIEVIQPHHRYVVCWPSVHPEGRLYRWYDENGMPAEIPLPSSLHPLPPGWIIGLAEPLIIAAGFGEADIDACLTGGAPDQKVADRLTRAVSDVAAAVGSRHDVACEHSLALLRYGRQGSPGVNAAMLGLQEVFVANVVGDGSRTPDEARNEFRRFITNKGAARLIAQPSNNDWVTALGAPPEIAPVNGHTVPDDKPLDTLETLEQDFWRAMPALALIYQSALSRMASPWAVLACVTARILCLAPPANTLPPIIGGPGSLNWFGAIAAKSGGGKGAAMAVASDLVDAPVIVRGIGSGEGMIEAYRRSSKAENPDPPVIAVLFSIDEISSLGAMSGRAGQTTTSIIKQGFSGERLGYSYRGRQSETVASHTYRMTLIAGVQPGRAGILFDDTYGGTPQRFMWFPGRDKRITAAPPEWPLDDLGRRRGIPLISANDFGRSLGTIAIPTHAATLIRAARAASMSGDDEALDGHALFCREKFAYALALMDANLSITDEHWRLSGIATAVSDWYRDKVHDAYQRSLLDAARERGVLRGEENDERELHEQQALGAHIARIAEWIVRTLTKHGPMTRGELNKRAGSRDRPRLHFGLSAVFESGRVKQLDDGKLGLP